MHEHLSVCCCWRAAFMAHAHLEAAENPKPNIILVMPDDVGPGDYACLGNPVSCLRRSFCVV